MTGHSLAIVGSGYGAAQKRAYTPMPPKPNPHLTAVVIPEKAETPSTPDMITRPIHVAILDDDQSVRTAIGRVLKMSEMTVDSCGTSLELFDAMAEKSPDCLVLDLQMPGMDGFDVMKYLGRRGVRVPTIVISAQDEPGSRESCLVAGATAYLRKPLDADELLKTIDEAVAAQANC
jgi:CheY-like chemotaxis protein